MGTVPMAQHFYCGSASTVSLVPPEGSPGEAASVAEGPGAGAAGSEVPDEPEPGPPLSDAPELCGEGPCEELPEEEPAEGEGTPEPAGWTQGSQAS